MTYLINQLMTILFIEQPLASPGSANKYIKKIYILCFKLFQYISLRPELSSPPCFRIQAGSSDRDTGGAVGVAGQHLPILI